MTLLIFVTALGLLSMAMVVAMVEFSKGYLAGGRDARTTLRWGIIYALLWAAIIGVLYAYAGDGAKNRLIIILFPVGWLALHALLLWFAVSLNKVEDRRPRLSRFEAPIEEEKEEEAAVEEELPPPKPTFAGRLIRLFVTGMRWAITISIFLIVIAIGQSLDVLHRLDSALDPYKGKLKVILPILIAAGFAMFMGGIIRFILQGGTHDEVSFRDLKSSWRDGRWRSDVRMRRFFFIGGGVLLMVSAGAAMGIVFTAPGMKLIFLLAFGYAATMTAIGFYRA